jgi:uncharacterized protein YndB with AHSA1/START domain
MISFKKNPDAKRIDIVREFKAPLQKVWSAWTQAELLDQWWGPKPYHVETKTLDFKVGGTWHYAMISPEGQTFWSICTYKAIDPPKSFMWNCRFCDENDWLVEFSENDGVTTVNVTLTFADVNDLENMVKMGFETGFTRGLNQLEELLG